MRAFSVSTILRVHFVIVQLIFGSPIAVTWHNHISQLLSLRVFSIFDDIDQLNDGNEFINNNNNKNSTLCLYSMYVFDGGAAANVRNWEEKQKSQNPISSMALVLIYIWFCCLICNAAFFSVAIFILQPNAIERTMCSVNESVRISEIKRQHSQPTTIIAFGEIKHGHTCGNKSLLFFCAHLTSLYREREHEKKRYKQQLLWLPVADKFTTSYSINAKSARDDVWHRSEV